MELRCFSSCRVRQFEATHRFENALTFVWITANLHFLVVAVVRQGAEENFTLTDEGIQVFGRKVLEQRVQSGT
ncbi:hypothetical protein D3C85_1349850 [compost metagenome]